MIAIMTMIFANTETGEDFVGVCDIVVVITPVLSGVTTVPLALKILDRTGAAEQPVKF